MHEAFFFGPVERQLFACYHPPANPQGRNLTILCPPIFAEYNRTHSMLRRLSISLASQGHHVIRFDYSGTGDSFGTLEALTIQDWRKDVQQVIQEGIELTGCSNIRLLGVRIGAWLACASAIENKQVERIVLWDPIYDGSDYFRSLQMRLASALSHNQFISRADRPKVENFYSGYELSENMIAEIRSLSTSGYAKLPENRLRVVRTVSSVEFPIPGVPEEFVPVDCQWDSEDEEVILSQPIIEILTDRLVRP